MLCRLFSRSLTIVAVAASLALGLPVSAQDIPQFITRADIKVKGLVVAEAGDLVNTSKVNGNQVTLVLGGPDTTVVNRSQLADMKEAIDVLASLIRKNPKEVRLYSVRANIHAIRKEMPEAIAFATRAIEIDETEDAMLYVNRGVFHAFAGQHVKASTDYVKATHLNSKLYSAYTSLAASYIARKEYQKAIDVCTSVIKVDKDNPAHYIQRGVGNRHLENWDEAIADFTKALELKPDNVSALGSRGFVNYLKADHAAAAKDFDAIIKLTPKDAMAYNNRGYNLYLSGNSKDALADYNKAVELLPSYATAWQNKAWLLATSPDDSVRNGQAAITAARNAAAQRKTKNPADSKALAAGHAEIGDFANAVRYQTEVVATVEPEGKAEEERILALYADKKVFQPDATITPVEDENVAQQTPGPQK